MGHFIFRLILGIVFAVCAGISAVRGDMLFTILYITLGAAFLWSAWAIRRRHHGR